MWTQFQALVRAVIDSSVANDWGTAVTEWEVTDVDEDPDGRGICVCGQPNLVQLFTIENQRNRAVLQPIGSHCVHQFERTDLNRQVDVFSKLLVLRAADRDGKKITLTSDYFSRALLEHFAYEGVFTPDQWNGHDGDNDYVFLLQMFNKHDKDSIMTRQQRKIYMLLRNKVLPFVRS